MGDKYEIRGQAGAVGPHAQAHGVNFVQMWNHPGQPVDLSKLAEELATLRQAMVEKATAPEHYTAIGEVASAETQAKYGNGPKVLEHLSKAREMGPGVRSGNGCTRGSGRYSKSKRPVKGSPVSAGPRPLLFRR